MYVQWFLMLYWVFTINGGIRFISQSVNNLFGFALAFCNTAVQDNNMITKGGRQIAVVHVIYIFLEGKHSNYFDNDPRPCDTQNRLPKLEFS